MEFQKGDEVLLTKISVKVASDADPFKLENVKVYDIDSMIGKRAKIYSCYIDHNGTPKYSVYFNDDENLHGSFYSEDLVLVKRNQSSSSIFCHYPEYN